MLTNRRTGPTRLLLALGAALTLVNGLALLGFIGGATSSTALASVHAAAAALAGGVALSTRDPLGGLALQLTLWSLAAGAFGSLVWLATALAGRQNAAPPDFADWLDAQIGDDTLDKLASVRAAICDDRVRLAGASRVELLRDIVVGGSSNSKYAALAAMARRYDPRMAPALDQALHSDDAAVRVLGAGILARLQQRYTDRVAELLANAEHNPRLAAAWRALADAHLTFADSGLLNPERRREAMSRAQDAQTLARTLAPATVQPRAAQGYTAIEPRLQASA